MVDDIIGDRSPVHSPPLLPLQPADEVEALLSQAREVKSLNSTLRSIVVKHKDLFLDVFGRQIDLIKSRSQALEDAHITVFDKVLLELTSNGNNLLIPAAVTWYCTEYFGFNLHVAEDHNVHAVEQSLALPVALSQESRRAQSPATHHRRHNPNPMLSPVPTSPAAQRAQLGVSQNGPRFSHYWAMYDKAVKDFNDFAHDESARAFEAARWLRDTAENGVHFLERIEESNEELIGSLKATYVKAQRRVESLSGGRKRKFDHHADLMERKRLRGLEQEESRHGTPDSQYKGDRRYWNRNNSRAPSPNDSAVVQARTFRHYGPNRGHSGIPYGYGQSRLVDSYVPSNTRRGAFQGRNRSRDRDRNRNRDRSRERSLDRGKFQGRRHGYDSYQALGSDSERDNKLQKRWT